jgi:hypothetical protein
MVKEIVKKENHALNSLPWKNGISQDMSPLSIVTGLPPPDFNDMKLEFGSYVQVHLSNEPSNTLKARTVGAIALTPTGNRRGDYNFMSLATGANITSSSWTALPIPNDAIARVESIARNEGQPLIQNQGLVFEWSPGQEVDADEYVRDYEPDDDADSGVSEDSGEYDDVGYDEVFDLQDRNWQEPQHNGHDEPHEPQALADGEGQGYVSPDGDDDSESHDADVMDPHDDGSGPYGDETGSEEEGANQEDEGAHQAEAGADQEDEEAHPGEEGASQPGQAHGYALRPRGQNAINFRHAIDSPHNGKSYFEPHQFLHLHDNERSHEALKNYEQFIFAFVMTQLPDEYAQMSAKKGIKKFGRLAEEALLAEFAQLEQYDVFEAVDPNTLTKDAKRQALRAINLIKKKKSGKIKGRTCADGRSQRNKYAKSETASPTVSTDALMLTLMIAAKEGRDVATADVVGAYLNAEMDDYVLLKLSGKDVEIFCEMNPAYKKQVIFERGEPVLYTRLLKALYGCVKSALLWYRLYTSHLKDLGFELNPYEPCVANSVINNNQCTIAWYVDDNIITHVDTPVVDDVIRNIEQRFGKMVVTRGKKHKFLGMDVDLSACDGTVTISMCDYLRDAINTSGFEIVKSATTPAKRNLFDVNESSPLLEGNDLERFHGTVAKLLYVAVRARMDLLLAVIFLCTRVSKASVEDQGKLRRLLEYIHDTIDMTYTLGADDLLSYRAWVDAAFAVHPDMKSHTGGIISFGTGGIACKSSRQKLNTKSSTEAELVGASDYLPNVLWIKWFLRAQGYAVNDVYLEQDNESAIKLETNGRVSSSAKTRHVAIRYFLSRIVPSRRASRCDIAPLYRCLLISSPNLYKAPFFGSSEP